MKVLRSWPLQFDRVAHRPHVVDKTERLMIDDYDYKVLGVVDDDVVLLEWDIAVSREGLAYFLNMAEGHPDRIMVAPYMLYESRPVPVWCHRRVDEDGRERWIENYELEAEYFSFGMIYLPRHLIQAFLAAPRETRGTPIGVEPDRYQDYRLTDQTFSVWHYRTYKTSVDVLWGVRPVHLNY